MTAAVYNAGGKRSAVRKLLIIGAALLSMLILLAGAGLYYITTPHFSQHAGDWLSQHSGRKIGFEGDIDIKLSREPRIIAHQVRIANAEWGSEPNMFSAERVEISLRPLALLRGRLELPEVIAAAPQLLLEKNTEGDANWHFSENPESAALEAPLPEDRNEFPLIGHLQITDGEVTYRDPARKIDTTLEVSTVQGEAEKDDAIKLQGKGSYRSQPFLLDLTGASVLQLRESDRPYPFKLETKIGPTRAAMEGTVQDPLKLEALDIALTLSGANAADLFPLTGIALPPTPPYRVKGRLRREKDNWFFEDFAGVMGDSDLRGSVAWYPEREPPYFKGNFASNNLDMKDLAGFIGAHRRPTVASRLIPDVPLDTSRMRAMNADASFRASRVKAPQILDRFAMDLSLDQGVLTLHPVSFSLAEGTIRANVKVQGRTSAPPVTADVAFDKLSLAKLFKPLADRYGEKNVTAGVLSGRANLKGNGKSLHEMLSNATGDIRLGMDGGQLSRLLLELAGLDLFKAAGLALAGDKPVPVHCLVGDFAVREGVMQARQVFIDTDVASARGEGVVDLDNEAIDLRVKISPKDATLFSARAPILVAGTLKDPSVGVDPKSLAARGGVAAALGALLTPPGALLAFMEPGSKEPEMRCPDTANSASAPQTKAVK